MNFTTFTAIYNGHYKVGCHHDHFFFTKLANVLETLPIQTSFSPPFAAYMLPM